jgi:cellulose synthase/poly-beta-1,6-N-acetylglucosamine synthase-like glycosyltransferase
MVALLFSLARRRWFLLGLTVLTLGMFVLMQLLFRFELGHRFGLVEPPDGRLYYTSAQLVGVLDALGPAGRQMYMYLHIPDMLFPLVYGLFFAALVVFFWGLRAGAVKAASWLAIVPAIGTVADWIENIAIAWVSMLFSAGHTATDIAASAPIAARLAGTATAMKWTCVWLSTLLILVGIAFLIVRRVAKPAPVSRRSGR